jgi:hypothetical protein
MTLNLSVRIGMEPNDAFFGSSYPERCNASLIIDVSNQRLTMSKAMAEASVYRCKCGLCEHDSRSLCIEGHCECCDLEDAFAILSHQETESPQSRRKTEYRVFQSLA